MFADYCYRRGRYHVYCKTAYHQGERLVRRGEAVWMVTDGMGFTVKICGDCYPLFVAQREREATDAKIAHPA